MRVAAEYLQGETRILLRLLGTVSPASNVQVGTYTVSWSPTRPPVEYDITADQIVNNEANLYLSNVRPFPSQLTVILPDATPQVVAVQVVQQPQDETLGTQPKETFTPREPQPHNPSELPPSVANAMAPPQYPPFWVELSFSRANPLAVGAGMDPNALLSYAGGGAGRVLSPTLVQEAADQPPYTIYAPTFLEGAFANDLPSSDFASTYLPSSGSLDPYPTGWSIVQSDPNSLVRVAVNPTGAVIPNFQIRWHLRPGFTDWTLSPPITVVSPPVPADDTFQVMLEVPAGNDTGTARLLSATKRYASTAAVLSGTVAMSLNVQDDPGPVSIEWQQVSPSSGAPQCLSVMAPMASAYPTTHTWLPYPNASAADVVTVSPLSFQGGPFNFSSGYVRVDADQQGSGQPLSWRLSFDSNSQTLLQVQGGTLSSDFSTKSVDLTALPLTGSYKLAWMSGQQFIIAYGSPELQYGIDFLLDLPIPGALLADTMTLTLSSFQQNAGSSRINYFVFRPEGS